MKFLVAFAVLIAVAAAAPTHDSEAVILAEHSDVSPDGSYAFGFETSNGQRAVSTGSVQQNVGRSSPEDAEKVVVVHGEYSYPGPDGVQYTVKYTADQDGFHPEGAHLPVA